MAGESLIEEAVQMALAKGWVKAHDHVVVVSRGHIGEFMVKVCVLCGMVGAVWRGGGRREVGGVG